MIEARAKAEIEGYANGLAKNFMLVSPFGEEH